MTRYLTKIAGDSLTMLLNPKSFSNLGQVELYQRAQTVMKRIDSVANTVSHSDDSHADDLEDKDGVSLSDRQITHWDGHYLSDSRQIRTAFLQAGVFEFTDTKVTAGVGRNGEVDLTPRFKEKGSRIQEENSTTYDYKLKGVKTHIVVNNTSGDVALTQRKEILGGLISWNIVK